MTKQAEITITENHINQLLMLYKASERRLDRAIENKSRHEDMYRAECLAYERVLDMLGIEYIES